MSTHNQSAKAKVVPAAAGKPANKAATQAAPPSKEAPPVQQQTQGCDPQVCSPKTRSNGDRANAVPAAASELATGAAPSSRTPWVRPKRQLGLQTDSKRTSERLTAFENNLTS